MGTLPMWFVRGRCAGREAITPLTKSGELGLLEYQFFGDPTLIPAAIEPGNDDGFVLAHATVNGKERT